MKRKTYRINESDKNKAETRYDADGNVVIPERYLIKETDTRRVAVQKNVRWREWQEKRGIIPAKDLPGFYYIRGQYRKSWREKQLEDWRDLGIKRKSAEQEAAVCKIAELEQRISDLQEQRTHATGAAFDELTAQINILRCKVGQIQKPVYQCHEANPHYY